MNKCNFEKHQTQMLQKKCNVDTDNKCNVDINNKWNVKINDKCNVCLNASTEHQ